MGKNVTELWGREFNIVKDGLSEVQVVAFVNELVNEQDMLIQRQEHLSSLTKLAERTVTEAEKLAEESKRQATDQAKAEASKIIAEAEARAQQIIEEKRAEIITKATKQAETIKANAEREGELILDRQRKRIQPELKEMAQRVYNQLVSQLEGLKGQVVAMEEEFERKLFPLTKQTSTATVDEEPSSTEVLASIPQGNNLTPGTSSEASGEHISDTLAQLQELVENIPDSAQPEEQPQATSSQSPGITDLTSEIEEEALVLGNNQAPTTYEEKVELEFLPPVNILQILEIDKYLETLPQVEATEIIPITDRPIITVFLREPIQLTDILSALPEVSQLNEDTDGEVTATSSAPQAEGKSRKIQVTLSGNTNTDKAEN